MKTPAFILLSVLLPASMQAQQQRCATGYYHQHFVQQEKSSERKHVSLSASAIIHIPVVVHVIYKQPVQNISYEQIQSQIDVLNEDFSGNGFNVRQVPEIWRTLAGDARIRFHLARRDPSGNPTSGITRTETTVDAFPVSNLMKADTTGGKDPWPDSLYLNIWVCNLANNVLGFAQFPGGSSSTDGIVIHTRAFGRLGELFAKYNRGRTVTHEAGHWLNLIHIWGDSNCGDDLISDTPVQKTSSSGCPVFPSVSCCNGNSNCNGPDGDMFMNFMDYTDDRCMMLFTARQNQRMQNAIASFRSSFINAAAHLPPSPPAVDLALADMNVKGLLCYQVIVPQVTVVNTGSQPVTSFSAEAGIVNGTVITASWNGNLNPGDSATVFFESLSLNPGEGVFFARLISTDDFEFNNYRTTGFLLTTGQYGCPLLTDKPVISLFPNPSSGLITIRSEFAFSNKVSLAISDFTGRIIRQSDYNKTENIVFLTDISRLPAGVYQVRIFTDTNYSALNFLKLNPE